jgi:multiple sugar transport system substrate-binding protein
VWRSAGLVIGVWLLTILLVFGARSDVDARMTIAFWHQFSSGTPKQAIDTLVAEFNETNRNIFVDAIAVAGYRDKAIAAIAAGAPPDVVYNLEAASFAPLGMLAPLDAYIERDRVNLKDFFPVAIYESTYGGKLYGLPKKPLERLTIIP